MNCMDRTQSLTVPVSHVRTIMTGASTLVHKVQRISDVTVVREALGIMQIQSQTAARETAMALENIKAEIKSNTERIQKSIAIGEAATTAAKHATDVSKIVAGMVRDIKNNGAQINVGLPMSYAAAAAGDTLASSMHNAPLAKPSSTQTQREVVVNIRNVLTVQNLRAMNLRNLKSYVERAVEQSGNENIISTKVTFAK